MVMGAVCLTGCIENTIPYPVEELEILSLRGEGFRTTIDAQRREVMLTLDEQTDISEVEITEVELTEGAVAEGDSAGAVADGDSVGTVAEGVSAGAVAEGVGAGVTSVRISVTSRNSGLTHPSVPSERVILYQPVAGSFPMTGTLSPRTSTAMRS